MFSSGIPGFTKRPGTNKSINTQALAHEPEYKSVRCKVNMYGCRECMIYQLLARERPIASYLYTLRHLTSNIPDDIKEEKFRPLVQDGHLDE